MGAIQTYHIADAEADFLDDIDDNIDRRIQIDHPADGHDPRGTVEFDADACLLHLSNRFYRPPSGFCERYNGHLRRTHHFVHHRST